MAFGFGMGFPRDTSAAGGPSLNLQFAGSATLDPSITFTRASSGSYYDSTGILRSATTNVPRLDYNPSTLQPLGLLIEEARTNLLTYSQQFDDSSWSKSQVSVTANATAAPDGTTTADKLTESTIDSYHTLIKDTTTAAVPYTWSCYIKAAERTFAFLYHLQSGSSVSINLSTGATGTPSGAVAPTAITVTSAGNGWYRLAMTATATAASNSFRIYITTSLTGAGTYTGNGTSGIYIWGAQLEAGAFATSYVPSTNTFTSRATTGTFYGSNGLIQTAAINVARFNYNPANLSIAPTLLLEAAATNLLTYSGNVAGTNWTVQAGITVSLNNAVSPDNTTTATLLTGVTANAVYQAATLATSTSYSLSIFAKGGTSTRSSLGLFDVTAGSFKGRLFIAWSAGVPSTFSSAGCTNITYTPLPNGWYRVSITVVSDAVNTSHRLYFYPDSIAANGTLSVWGAQLEAGSGATSYIPTVASQVTRDADVSSSAAATRAADNAAINTLTPWYNATEGTLYVETGPTADNIYPTGAVLTDGTPSNNILIQGANPATSQQFYIVSGGVAQVNLATQTFSSTRTKTAAAYKVNDFAYSTQGAAVSTDVVGSVPTVSQFVIGAERTSNFLNGTILSISYYPRRLSDTELQSITA